MKDQTTSPTFHALVRPPGDSFAQAISSSGARIDVALARRQHAEYCQALAAAGVSVQVLSPDERYPDGCFMQDPALVIDGLAVICRMGAASRRGEEDLAAEALDGRFPTARIVDPGTLEGGDVLVLPDRVLVGASDRSNRAGIAQLAVALATAGIGGPGGAPRPVLEASVAGYLHLLSAVTYLGRDTLLMVDGFPGHPALAHLEILVVPAGEAYACNALAIGDRVILPAGYPATAALLRAHGFEVLPVPTGEFAKADGGVTCLSLVWKD